MIAAIWPKGDEVVPTVGSWPHRPRLSTMPATVEIAEGVKVKTLQKQAIAAVCCPRAR